MATADKVPMLAEGHRRLSEQLRHLKNVERPAVVEALVYVAVLTLIVSRRILATIRRRHPDKAHRMPNGLS